MKDIVEEIVGKDKALQEAEPPQYNRARMVASHNQFSKLPLRERKKLLAKRKRNESYLGVRTIRRHLSSNLTPEQEAFRDNARRHFER